jgi:UDP-2-acetamido-3-amino-2,3-dideoxy-glucuronate N-acetyltransferase
MAGDRQSPMGNIHTTAQIEPSAIVGDRTKVWHYAHIRAGAKIGSDCIIGRGVYINSGAQIGNKVKIQNYCHIASGVCLRDGVFVGPHVSFVGDRLPRAVTPDFRLKNRDDWVGGKVLVDEGASIGSNATILCDVTIGRWAMIAAGSTVVRDVPEHAIVVGNPARVVGFACRCGNKFGQLKAAQACLECRIQSVGMASPPSS